MRLQVGVEGRISIINVLVIHAVIRGDAFLHCELA